MFLKVAVPNAVEQQRDRIEHTEIYPDFRDELEEKLNSSKSYYYTTKKSFRALTDVSEWYFKKLNRIIYTFTHFKIAYRVFQQQQKPLHPSFMVECRGFHY